MSRPKDSRSGLAMSFLDSADAAGGSHAGGSSSRNGSHRSSDASRNPHASSSSSLSRPPRAFGNAFGDDEDDEHAEHHNDRSSRRNGHGGRREELTGYSRSGAEKARRSPSPQGPRVIPLVGGSDWRGDRKRRLGLENLQDFGSLTSMRAGGAQEGKAVPPPRDSELHRSAGAGEGVEKIGDEKQKVGLQVRGKSRREEEEEEEMRRLQESATAEDKTPPLDKAAPSPPPSAKMTEDEQARRALLSGQGSTLPSLNADRTIALRESSSAPISEEQAFKYDADSRPDAPSLDDYAATPVEEFGKALLRGMGWREGMGAGKGGVGPNAPPEVKKRSALLGLGAKERPAATAAAASSATGGAGVKRDFKVKRPDTREYKPLVRREAVPVQEEGREHSRSAVSSSRREGENRGSKRSHSPGERSRRREGDDYDVDRRRDTGREYRHEDRDRLRDKHRDRDRDGDSSRREHYDSRRHRDRDRDRREDRGSRDEERRRERYRERSPR
ncbi:hypothetical protein BCV69DRAFT_281510 [Microstroma glucosiphilum]|uniref:G-patch domain-containing protein n=1 Tax=Pseudomicrostroma glucosiphilum TaxID=1684307 RepID=A0A316UBC4_9BASI|nr:hypothetical protein BCV69DRAFT_281510 [Pseudomicrostroma glucosiphilum]PWN22530.1 hypothetical protein BCV69DRAFT_281510 [Pseudomicrostroma glucosiphilum]